ncbi:hypothetical protein KGM_205453 [Danaus plexippus plexippus]|uniref:Uncharacterized protein n=1 Tax=Danaus plexippus plexippus TaxID=278856 RepID=A0A212ETR0_DANPL|nr:hypothetical protein KGM_205453 [Danaus plexippus plexippus]
MDKAYEYVKSAIITFKLETCCCFAPIRVGVLIVGYFNLFISILSLMGTADGGITPPLMEVQDQFLEDNASKPVGIIAYSSELAFSALLLGAMYRNDIVLLRVYMYYVVVTIVTSILVYSMVIAAVSLLTKMVIIGNMVYNGYVILLVRSAIVEIKETRTSEKNGHVTLYSVAKFQCDEEKIDIGNVSDTEPSKPIESLPKEENVVKENESNDKQENKTPQKLETVAENPKEE